jgi:hypothetical protein
MKMRTDTRESGQARTSTACASLLKAFTTSHIALQARRATSIPPNSNSEEEVNNDPSFFVAENARLNDLLDNHDDVLRKTNKEKREYRSLLGEAKEKVVELEFLLVDARAQIDSLKFATVVTNEPECTYCSVFLVDLTMLKEKYASKVEELDVLRFELDEMKYKPSKHFLSCIA